jgi:MFS family permease
MLSYGLAMPLAGYLVGRIGTRNVLLLGITMVAASTAWMLVARDPLAFGLAFGGLLSIGLAFTSPVALTPMISRWFNSRRGMALLYLSTGSMAGMALLTPVLTYLIETLGWRHTMVTFSSTLAACVILACWRVIRDEAPEDADLSSADRERQSQRAAPIGSRPLKLSEVMVTGPFWKIVLGMFACGFSMNLLGTHGMPMLMDHGFDAASSSHGIGLIGFVAIFGTILLGRVADKLARKNLLALIYAVRGVGFFVLVIVGAHWELYLAATIGGIVWAGSIALSSAVLADVYGIRLVGVLYGLVYVSHQAGGALSSWLGGWGYETLGSHWLAFGGAGALLMLAAAISYQLPPRGYVLSVAR